MKRLSHISGVALLASTMLSACIPREVEYVNTITTTGAVSTSTRVRITTDTATQRVTLLLRTYNGERIDSSAVLKLGDGQTPCIVFNMGSWTCDDWGSLWTLGNNELHYVGNRDGSKVYLPQPVKAP